MRRLSDAWYRVVYVCMDLRDGRLDLGRVVIISRKRLSWVERNSFEIGRDVPREVVR